MGVACGWGTERSYCLPHGLLYLVASRMRLGAILLLLASCGGPVVILDALVDLLFILRMQGVDVIHL